MITLALALGAAAAVVGIQSAAVPLMGPAAAYPEGRAVVAALQAAALLALLLIAGGRP
jgi:hypothetical protein